MDIAFPFAIDGHGRTARADEAAHVRQMIEQLIFTAPGERVNRPDFGSGIQQLVFAPNSPELAATLQFTLQAAIQHSLSDVIDIQGLTASAAESSLTVELAYVLRRTGAAETASFTRTF
jgi:phage baseplate assembly protein W